MGHVVASQRSAAGALVAKNLLMLSGKGLASGYVFLYLS